MELVQWLGGGLYLLNKVFLAFKERARYRGNFPRARYCQIAAWSVYLCGLPFWLFIFLSRHNWIAAAEEASGLPAMLLGLVTALCANDEKTPSWLDCLALVCILLGLLYSLYDIGPMTAFTQWLEAGLALGFLAGTYQLARQKTAGYLWFALMNVSCGCLMWLQNYPWLALQQALSLGFVADAYRMARREPKKLS